MPCQIDTVTIKFGCQNCNFIIKNVTIVGSAAPCNSFLVVGKRVAPARRCLLKNGFVLVSNCKQVYVFKRRRFF
jgi:hypothetical protein